MDTIRSERKRPRRPKVPADRPDPRDRLVEEREGALRLIRLDQTLLLIIVSHEFAADGVRFVTPPSLSQQLAIMAHPKGHTIRPHRHIRHRRHIDYTQEVLVIRKGRVRVDLYDDRRRFLNSYEAAAGDVVMLCGGGHGFEILEDVEMVEVKQGPYTGESDKRIFTAVGTDAAGTRD